MENIDLSQFGHAAETAANAYMLETICGVVVSIVIVIFFIKTWFKF